MYSLDEQIDQFMRGIEIETAKFEAELAEFRQRDLDLIDSFADVVGNPVLARERMELGYKKKALMENLAENRKALTALRRGMLPSGGSLRWVTRPGYDALQTACNQCSPPLIDFEVSLSTLEPEFSMSGADLNVDIGDSAARPPSWSGPADKGDIATVWGS